MGEANVIQTIQMVSDSGSDWFLRLSRLSGKHCGRQTNQSKQVGVKQYKTCQFIEMASLPP